MIKINEKPVEVNTPNGIGTIEDIIVTSLGHIQVRVKFNDGDDTTYMKYIVSSFELVCVYLLSCLSVS